VDPARIFAPGRGQEGKRAASEWVQRHISANIFRFFILGPDCAGYATGGFLTTSLLRRVQIVTSARLQRVFPRKSPNQILYSFCFTLTTVILENPSSKVGAFSLELMRRIASSGTTRSRR